MSRGTNVLFVIVVRFLDRATVKISCSQIFRIECISHSKVQLELSLQALLAAKRCRSLCMGCCYFGMLLNFLLLLGTE